MDHKVAIVTGGSQGLGYALAEALLGAGWSVVFDGRRIELVDDAVERFAELAENQAVSVAGLAGDVTDPAHRSSLADAARSFGPVRLLVNNASTLGSSPLPPVDHLDTDTFRRIFDVNVIAPAGLIAEVAEDLGPDAVVVNISSDAAEGAYEGWGGYGSSKAALDQLTAILAVEHPEWRVLSVDPGDMRTEMHQDAFPGEDIGDRPLPATVAPQVLALIEGGQPSGRYQASEVSQ